MKATSSQEIKRFLKECLKLAQEKMKKGHGGPFGALVVKDGKIVGRGWNSVTSTNDPTAHAEVMAIRDACRRLKSFQLEDCDLYTSCEPCPMCLGAIYWARPRTIYYAADRHVAARAGFDDEFIYKELAKKDLKKRKIPLKQFLSREGSKPFASWKKKRDKIPY